MAYSTDSYGVATGALVVGGGPSGYATAMALSKQGFQDILILERSTAADDFDPVQGFVYNISAPGRAALARLGLSNVADEGVPDSAYSLHTIKLLEIRTKVFIMCTHLTAATSASFNVPPCLEYICIIHTVSPTMITKL